MDQVESCESRCGTDQQRSGTIAVTGIFASRSVFVHTDLSRTPVCHTSDDDIRWKILGGDEVVVHAHKFHAVYARVDKVCLASVDPHGTTSDWDDLASSYISKSRSSSASL
ncbi:hypothetical protein IscW_ISCW004918 [Ixodes scapularis]|uniref:Uncharacterized protein n=1 Tax=Ixodes scapularis TaxID=6945 RepID=B7PFY4_IXOSC|nr:hypothetical protein IscW_ISCW004918 [Ixodes scapularis]|eukprot:XP_002434106.1 hypothetical protein IscW_ISCW004918 [Ixodes scapularis]